MTLEDARAKANEFLSSIFGPGDARQPQKAEELAQMLLEAQAGGGVSAEPAAASDNPRKKK